MSPPLPGDVHVRPARQGGAGGVVVGRPRSRVASRAELATILPNDRGEGFQVWVEDEEDFFVYRAESLATPGSNITRPDDLDQNEAGRWEREIEKGAPDGVATLDGDGNLAQPAKTVREEGGDALDLGPIADGESVRREGDRLVGYSPVTSEQLIPGAPVFWEIEEAGVTVLELLAAVPPELVYGVRLYRNGLRMQYRGTPAGLDQYRIEGSQIVLGAASRVGTEYQADFWQTA